MWGWSRGLWWDHGAGRYSPLVREAGPGVALSVCCDVALQLIHASVGLFVTVRVFVSVGWVV